MSKPIYLDNQSTTPMDPLVLNAMLPFFKEKFGNASSIYHPYGLEAKDAVEKARLVLAKSIKAQKREIIFTSGATEAINLAIKGVAAKYKKNHQIITQSTEHSAVIDTCNSIKRKGWSVVKVPVDNHGLVDPKTILNSINSQTVLVAIMHANNEIGSIQPIKEIGKICKDRDIIFFVDACQSYGKLDLNMEEMNINMLAVTGHKIYGPKGIGFLYVSQKKPKIDLEMQIDGGGHERGYRSGTLSVPLIVGFAKAVEICEKRQKSENLKLKKLRDCLYHGIKNAHPDVILNGSFDNRLNHNLNVCFPDIDAETIVMKTEGIACSIGSACGSMERKPSHVLKALGYSNELAHSAIRFSLGRFNTMEEINRSIGIINETVGHIKMKKIKRKSRFFNKV